MSTRCYDTDLNDAAWAWIAPYLPAAPVGWRPRTTDLRAVLNAILLPAANRLPVTLLALASAAFPLEFDPQTGRPKPIWKRPEASRRTFAFVAVPRVRRVDPHAYLAGSYRARNPGFSGESGTPVAGSGSWMLS